MKEVRAFHTATLLPDGRVMVTGGGDDSRYLAGVEVYDPAMTTFAVTGPLEIGRAQQGVKYAAMNPGATFQGLHDSVVNYGGDSDPQFILCNHEELAVAIAHG